MPKYLLGRPKKILLALASRLELDLKFASHISYFLMRNILTLVSRSKDFDLTPNLSKREVDTPLDQSELQTLRYLGGFLVRCLIRDADFETAAALRSTIEEDPTQVEKTSLLEYTRGLLDALDRGRLIHINDHFFTMLITMEKLVKSQFTKTRPDLKDIVTKSLACMGIARDVILKIAYGYTRIWQWGGHRQFSSQKVCGKGCRSFPSWGVAIRDLL